MNPSPKYAILLPSLVALCILDSFSLAPAQAPVLEVRLPQETAHVDEPYRVIYETSWEGPADAFAVVPADPETVHWASSSIVETATRTLDGKRFVTQTVEFVPYEAGEFEVAPFVVSYFDPALIADSEDSSEEDAATPLPPQEILRAAGFTVTVRPDLGPYMMYGTLVAAVAALSALGGWTLTRRRHRARLARASTKIPVPQTARAALNLARQYRLDGKFYEFYKELSRAATLLAPSVAARKLREKLEADVKEVGYRGVRPTDEGMDGALKDVEEALQPGPDEDQ